MLFLRKGGEERRRDPGTSHRPGPDPGGPRIRCPRCAWEPRRQDTWACICLHVWNTFETGGVCPACGREWRETQCLRCHEWSPHADWYVEDH
jgi:hypothetical protein